LAKALQQLIILGNIRQPKLRIHRAPLRTIGSGYRSGCGYRAATPSRQTNVLGNIKAAIGTFRLTLLLLHGSKQER